MYFSDKKIDFDKIDNAYKLEDTDDFDRFDNRKELEEFLHAKYKNRENSEELIKAERMKYFSFIYYAHYICDISFFNNEETDIDDPYFDYENLVDMNKPSISFDESLYFIHRIYYEGYFLNIEEEEFKKYYLEGSSQLDYAFRVALRNSLNRGPL